jgi:hypothetical protein
MYLKDATRDSAVKTKESELSVELFNGAKITLYGADNPDALRGIYLDGVILDEYGDCRPSLWGEVILPTLTDRQGWATFIGTPKGKNHFYRIRELARRSEDWYYLEVKASESGILAEKELAMAKQIIDEDQYMQEFECSFDAAVKGTYYSSMISELESADHMIDLLAEPDEKTDVALDLGFTDSTAMWFWQNRTDGFAFVDYEEQHGQKLDYYFDYLRKSPYDIGTLYLPHDARAKTLQTGRSTVEQLVEYIEINELGWELEIVPRLDIQDGINAVRQILPRCWFDKDKCYDGIEALRAYKRKWNEITKAFSNKPDHDWSSHGCDAFRQFALVATQKVGSSKGAAQILRQQEFESGKYPIALEQLFSDREKRIVAWKRSNRI